MTGLVALALCMLGDVAPGLQNVYCKAVYAWAPYHAEVRQVKWCDPGECRGMGGGMFHFDTRVISSNPEWLFKGGDLLLTVEHESGHPQSLHFNDEAGRYAAGQLRDVYFNRAQLRGHTEREYHPGS